MGGLCSRVDALLPMRMVDQTPAIPAPRADDEFKVGDSVKVFQGFTSRYGGEFRAKDRSTILAVDANSIKIRKRHRRMGNGWIHFDEFCNIDIWINSIFQKGDNVQVIEAFTSRYSGHTFATDQILHVLDRDAQSIMVAGNKWIGDDSYPCLQKMPSMWVVCQDYVNISGDLTFRDNHKHYWMHKGSGQYRDNKTNELWPDAVDDESSEEVQIVEPARVLSEVGGSGPTSPAADKNGFFEDSGAKADWNRSEIEGIDFTLNSCKECNGTKLDDDFRPCMACGDPEVVAKRIQEKHAEKMMDLRRSHSVEITTTTELSMTQTTQVTLITA